MAESISASKYDNTPHIYPNSQPFQSCMSDQLIKLFALMVLNLSRASRRANV